MTRTQTGNPLPAVDGPHRALLLSVAQRAIDGLIPDINCRRDGSLMLLAAGKDLMWTGYSPEAELLKGLIVRVDEALRVTDLVAGCLAKFYNHGESADGDLAFADALGQPGAELVFTTKSDGSNLRPYLNPDNGSVEFATRGMLQSASGSNGFTNFAALGHEIASVRYPALLDPALVARFTMICELIHPTNRIITHYGDLADLPVITVIDLATGDELRRAALEAFCYEHGLKPVERLMPTATTFLEAIAQLRQTWTDTDLEGTVAAVELPGRAVPLRIKVKAERYLALFRLFHACSLRRTRELVETNGLTSLDALIDYLRRESPELPEEVQSAYADHYRAYALWEAANVAATAEILRLYDELPLRTAADQKAFALSIAASPHRAAFFELRRRGPEAGAALVLGQVRRSRERELRGELDLLGLES